jgi:hypothetical protein
LRAKEISWNEIREYVKEKQTNECIYCGSDAELTLEHLCLVALTVPTPKEILFGSVKAAIPPKAKSASTSIGLTNTG